MKRALLAIALLVGCGGKTQPDVIQNIPYEVDPTLAVQASNGSAGHACPVNGYVVSAAHVFYDKETKSFVQGSWSDGYKNEGYLAVNGGHSGLDMVTLAVSNGEVIKYLPAGIAEVGERVYWFEYDFRSKSNALRARRRFADVLRVVAKHYILDEEPVGGASGGCLLNSKGEAVGIVISAWEVNDGSGVGAAFKLPEEVYGSVR